MAHYPPSIQQLIERLAQLPTIGPKTAERIVFALLKRDRSHIQKLGQDIAKLSEAITQCTTCFNFSEKNPCNICSDTNRDQTLLCVVTDPQDVAAIERTGTYHGVYFILGMLISTYHGTGPQEARIPQLLKRVKADNAITEIILALDPTVEGETTTLYIAKQLHDLNKKTSRLARGLPVGADVEYADEVTLTAALENRREV